MKNLKQIIFLLSMIYMVLSCSTDTKSKGHNIRENIKTKPKQIETGAEQIQDYLPLITNKRIALVVNQTSQIKGKHLLDTFLNLKINVVKIFALEHGFRGNVSAGETIKNSRDTQTGVEVVSLYRKDKTPTAEELKDIDIVVFDIQDVGVRFYTYISSLSYIMEACANNGKELLVFDRPNPNGDYVAGPILDMKYKSFVGMFPIPVVHGCTVGEIAMMINGENWLAVNKKCNLKVVKCKNYTHDSLYVPPVKPSPNLPDYLSIRLYPSICLFEGTCMSLGRGTYFPFKVIGYPDPSLGEFSFVPQVIDSMAKKPDHEGVKCFGVDLRNLEAKDQKFTLKYLIEFYNKFSDKNEFFNQNGGISWLVGKSTVQDMIIEGKSEIEIVDTWKHEMEEYMKMRKKYLLYP